jgi:hypothetical protein
MDPAQAQRTGMRLRRLFLFVCLLFCLGAAAGNGDDNDGRWAILIAGVSGDADLQKMYLKEIADLHSMLEGPLGFPRDQIVVLFDNPALNPELIKHQSTRENLQAVCLNLSGRVKKEDLLFVFMEGHGSYDGQTYQLNLVGRHDPTAEDLAAMLYAIPAQRFIVVNVTNCSGGSLQALSQKGKIVITATKSGMEKNQTQLGRHFVDALKDNAADFDKNGRVSLFEAFSYARRKVEEYYQREGNLQTEHAVLNDNGGTQAQGAPVPENEEGLLARTVFLDKGAPISQQENLTPEQLTLKMEAEKLMRQIESLKFAKKEMSEEEYEKRLEDLLLRLARVNEKLSK